MPASNNWCKLLEDSAGLWRWLGVSSVRLGSLTNSLTGSFGVEKRGPQAIGFTDAGRVARPFAGVTTTPEGAPSFAVFEGRGFYSHSDRGPVGNPRDPYGVEFW
jgi:hypothetical protein